MDWTLTEMVNLLLTIEGPINDVNMKNKHVRGEGGRLSLIVTNP